MRLGRSYSEYRLGRPVVVSAPPPPTQQQQTVAVSLTAVASSRVIHRTARSIPPWPVVVSATPVAPPDRRVTLEVSYVGANDQRTQRVERGPRSYLYPPQVVTIASTFVAAPVRVALIRIRPRPAQSQLRRGVTEPSLRIPDRRLYVTKTLTRTRPRKTIAALTYVVYPATGRIATWVVRTRPRPTRYYLTTPRVEPSLRAPDRRLQIPASLARIRPPRTHAALTAVTYPAAGSVSAHLTRTRPRPTTKILLPPVVEPSLRPPDRRLELVAALVRTRPRPTRRALTYVVYPQVSSLTTTLVRIRPRPTTRFLTAVSYPQVTPVVEAEVAVRTVQDDRRRRGIRSTLAPPIFYTATSTIRVTVVRTRPRHTRAYLTALSYPATSSIRVVLVRARPRPTRTSLTAVTYPASSRIAVATTRTRPKRTRWFLTAVTYPEVTPISEAEVTVKTVQDDLRRRQPSSALFPPQFYPASSLIIVKQVRARPRPTARFLLAPVVEPALRAPDRRLEVPAVLVRIRPRHTQVSLTAVEYPATSVIAVHLTRARPRPTVKVLRAGVSEPPLQPPDRRLTILAALIRTRPRPTRHALTAIGYAQETLVTETTVAVKTVVDDRARRRTRYFATPPVVEPPLRTPDRRLELPAALVRVRPRRTRWVLTAVTYPATSQIRARLARTRPRPTARFLTAVEYPQVTPLAETLIAVKTVVDDRRRRGARSVLAPPVFYPATSAITVTLVRARPRRTHAGLSAITYRATGVVRATLVHARPRPTRFWLTSVTYPEITPVTETTVAVKTVVDDRQRRRTRSFLPAGVVEPALRAPDRRLEVPAALVRARPRQTRRYLTAVAHPATNALTTTLVRTRPRHTVYAIPPPSSLEIVQQPVVTTLAIHVVRIRPRPTRKYIIPPVVEASLRPPDRRLEIPAALTRIRPRTTRYALTAVTYPATSTIRAQTVRTRPRPTIHTGLTHIVYAAVTPVVEETVSVTTVVNDQTRRRTRYWLTSVTYPATSTIATRLVRARPRRAAWLLTATSCPQAGAIGAHLVRNRPRLTLTRLAPPPTGEISQPPVVTTITARLVRVRPRPTRTRLTAISYRATSRIAVTVARIRPRRVLVLLSPPPFGETTRPPVEITIRAHTTRTRPRATRHSLSAVSYPATGRTAVVLTRTRPRVTRASLPLVVPSRPPVVTTIALAFVRTRPPKRFARLQPPAVVIPFFPPVVTTLSVSLTHTRPRGTRYRIELPATVFVCAPGAGSISDYQIVSGSTITDLPAASGGTVGALTPNQGGGIIDSGGSQGSVSDYPSGSGGGSVKDRSGP